MKTISRRAAMVALAVILLVGFGLRAAIILRYSQGPCTFSDDKSYLIGGVTFSNTGYVSTGEADEQSTAIGPGMPIVIGVLIRLFGYSPQGLQTVHLAFSCFGLLIGVALYLMGTLLHSRWAGLIAAALGVLEPGLLSTGCVFLTETPYACLNLFAIYGFLRCSQSWSLRHFWMGVLCMIAAAFFKGLALLSCIVVIPVLWRRRVPVKKWIGKVAVAALAFVLCFAPWWVRNDALLHRFVPFTANRGDIQLMGSYMGIGCPEGTYDEMVVQLDAEAWQEEYQADVERRFARRGEVGKERLAQWFRENPLAFVFSHVIYKPVTMTLQQNLSINVLPGKLESLVWWGLLAVALWGLLFGRKSGRADAYAPALYLLVGVLVTAVYAPLGRYGVPYAPLWLLYASFGFCHVLQHLPCGARKKQDPV